MCPSESTCKLGHEWDCPTVGPCVLPRRSMELSGCMLSHTASVPPGNNPGNCCWRFSAPKWVRTSLILQLPPGGRRLSFQSRVAGEGRASCHGTCSGSCAGRWARWNSNREGACFRAAAPHCPSERATKGPLAGGTEPAKMGSWGRRGTWAETAGTALSLGERCEFRRRGQRRQDAGVPEGRCECTGLSFGVTSSRERT